MLFFRPCKSVLLTDGFLNCVAAEKKVGVEAKHQILTLLFSTLSISASEASFTMELLSCRNYENVRCREIQTVSLPGNIS